MRKKSMRMLSLTLAAVLALSSANTGIVAMAATPEAVVTEETTEVQSTEAVEETTEVQSTEAEKEYLGIVIVGSDDEDSVEVTTEAAAEEVAVTKEENSQDLIEEELELKKATGPLANVITDATFLSALKEEYAKSHTEELTTFEQLQAWQTDLDLSKYSITEIPADAFLNCSFTSVNLPNTLTRIGSHAFANCSKLKTISAGGVEGQLPANLTFLGANAFEADIALTKIIIPSYSNGNILSTSAFAGCTGLTSIEIGAGITSIPVTGFTEAGSNTEDGVTITIKTGSQLNMISKEAFRGAKIKGGLDLSMCSELKTFSESAFDSAIGISTVVLPASVTSLELGKNAFAKTDVANMYASGSTVKTGVVLPDYVAAIGEGCFYGNTVMKAVTLPSNTAIKEVPDYLFDGCSSLATVTVPAGFPATVIGDCAFRGTAITDTEFLMNMPNLKRIGYQRLDAESVKTVGYGVGKEYYNKGGGFPYSGVQTKEQGIKSLPLGGVSSSSSDRIVPDEEDTTQKTDGSGVYYGSEVFSDCGALTSIHIPAWVEQIGGRAFYFQGYDDPNNKNAYVESLVESFTWNTTTGAKRTLGVGALQGNMKLAAVTLPSNAGDTLYIGAYAFANDKSLTTINGNNVLPASVQELGDGAFYWCRALPSITISANKSGCPELGEKVFERCTSLTSATVPGDITEIPRHFFYDVPLASFTVGSGAQNKITKIGALAFCGNQFTEVDLTKWTSLEEIDGGAFAYLDVLEESVEKDKAEETKGSYLNIVSKTKFPQLTTVKLPKDLNHDLYINSAVFACQIFFNTMYEGETGTAKVIKIPDYITDQEQEGLFYATGVEVVQWEADTTKKNPWSKINLAMYAGCEDIKDGDIKNVLPQDTSHLAAIHKTAFWSSNVTKADLSEYKALESIGSGTSLTGLTKNYPEVFGNCSLTEIKLPTKAEGEKLVLESKAFYMSTVDVDKTTVDLGSVTLIGDYAFQECTGIVSLVFPDSLTEVGSSAFMNCTALKTVNFGKITKIGVDAFNNCKSLVLTDSNGLPDTLNEIGGSAFANTESLGKAYFGEALETIGASAFETSGLTEVEFNSPKLKSIGKKAFSKTQLVEFTMTGTQVEQIDTETLAYCDMLEKATFGSEVAYINDNALAGCPMFNYFEFSSTTTVSPQAFYKVSSTSKKYTAQDKGGTISIQVNGPKDPVVIPIGKTVNMPYYASKYETASTNKSPYVAIIVDEGAKTDESKKYIKVSGELLEGYYWGRKEASDGDTYKITDSEYFEEKKPTPTYTRTDTSIKNLIVNVIQVEGKEATPEPLSFKMVCTANFSVPNNSDGYEIKVNDFEVEYKLSVEDIPIYSDLYLEQAHTNLVEDGVTNSFQRSKSNANNSTYLELYYDIRQGTTGTEENFIDSYNVVVETDNPAVMYPSTAKAGNITEQENGSITTNVTKAGAGNQKFYLIPAGVGTARITVYPEGHTKYKKTYIYSVNTDISGLNVSVPAEYTDGAEKGDTFSIFDSFTTYLTGTETFNSLTNYHQYTNNTIKFAVKNSTDAAYLSVNEDTGVVTVLNQDFKVVNVKVNCIYTTPAGATTTRECVVIIKAGTPDISKASVVRMYEDSSRRTEITANGENISMTGDKMVLTRYFTVTNEVEAEYLDTYNVVVETSNANVLYPAANSSGTKATSFTTTNGSTKNTYGFEVAKPAGQQFCLIATASGSATITVYPVGHPEAKKTFNYTVKVQIGQNAKVTDEKTGATVQVTKEGKQGSEGEVSFVAPKQGATDVTVPDTVEIEGVKYKVTSIPNGAFKDNTTVKTVTVGKNVTQIGNDAFSGCTALTKIVIPASVTSIGERAFFGCKNLKTVTIKGNKLKEFKTSTFEGCVKLATIKIPNSVETIGPRAFFNCKKLKKVNIAAKSKLKTIGNSAFEKCVVLPNITWTKKVTTIGSRAFAGCKKLKKITVKSTVLSSVGSEAFTGIHKKAVIKVPKKKLAAYRNLLSNKGQKKTVKVKK